MSAGAFATIQVITKVTKDVQGTKRIWTTDPPMNFQIDNAFLTKGGVAQILEVPNLAVDQALSLGALTTAKLILIETDGPITVRLAGGGTQIAIGAAGQPGFLALLGAGHTTLLVSNSSGATRYVNYAVAGS